MQDLQVPKRFWDVYNYIAASWYTDEYGQVEAVDRWYQPAMIYMERLAAQIRGLDIAA